MLFKLVFISHYYHKSPSRELFLKHSVFLPLNKTGMRKQGHLNFIYPGGPTAVLSISMLHTVTIKQRITNLGALFDLHVGLWSLLIVSSHFQSDSIIFNCAHCIENKNLCGRDGRTICGPLCVPKSTYVTLAHKRKEKFFYFGCSLVRRF